MLGGGCILCTWNWKVSRNVASNFLLVVLWKTENLPLLSKLPLVPSFSIFYASKFNPFSILFCTLVVYTHNWLNLISELTSRCREKKVKTVLTVQAVHWDNWRLLNSSTIKLYYDQHKSLLYFHYYLNWFFILQISFFFFSPFDSVKWRLQLKWGLHWKNEKSPSSGSLSRKACGFCQ